MLASLLHFAFLAQADANADAERAGENVGMLAVFVLFPIVFAILWFVFHKRKA
jgi:hypothetical protein